MAEHRGRAVVTVGEPLEKVASDLARAGFNGLFLSGDHSSADDVWRGGANHEVLEQIVRDERFDDLERVLASEVLYANDPTYPPAAWAPTLGQVYSRALAITGVGAGPIPLQGNLWGFMYGGDRLGLEDAGVLGNHLVAAGAAAIPPLIELLDDEAPILYEGSHEATLGNSFRYRVKDAAAYFLGKLSGIAVPFRDEPADRDQEISRLREALADRG
jgi:hypothetical protein